MMRKVWMFALGVTLLLSSILIGCGCGDIESTAKRKAINLAENQTGLSIHQREHDLNVRETGRQGEKVYYVVRGTIYMEDYDFRPNFVVEMEHIEEDRLWRLLMLEIHNVTLYP